MEEIKVKGKIQIINPATGEVEYEKENLVVNTGLSLIADRLKTNTINPLSHIAVGTGATTVSATDTALVNELARNAATNIDTPDNQIIIETEFGATEAIGNWKEAGIFNAATGGTMFNRVNIDYNKSTQPAIVRFTITFSS